jgi:hypothetical protein
VLLTASCVPHKAGESTGADTVRIGPEGERGTKDGGKGGAEEMEECEVGGGGGVGSKGSRGTVEGGKGGTEKMEEFGMGGGGGEEKGAPVVMILGE